jgi:hypothetical protein
MGSGSSTASGSSTGASGAGATGSTTGSSRGDAGAEAGSGGGLKFDHLVVILMENHNLNAIYGTATFMTKLADDNVLLQKYTAVDHPSEPNYLAIASGQTFSPTSQDDNYHVFNAVNLVDRLESIGLTWRAYTESAAGPCDTTNPDVRHVPFVFFSDVVTNSARCNRVVGTTPNTDAEMIAELNTSAASSFIWLTPNDNNNMHNGTIAHGDMYLSNLVPQILGSKTFLTTRAALFIVFDEGTATYPADFVYAVWAGPAVKKTTKSMTVHTHYSFLATLEQNWGLPSVTNNDATAAPMMEAFP